MFFLSSIKSIVLCVCFCVFTCMCCGWCYTVMHIRLDIDKFVTSIGSEHPQLLSIIIVSLFLTEIITAIRLSCDVLFVYV